MPFSSTVATAPSYSLKTKNKTAPAPCPTCSYAASSKTSKDSLETNFASKRNLETVKTTLEQYISNLPHVGDPLPKTWAQVRSVLENQALGSDHYISIQDYRQICTAQGIPTRNEQDRLSRFFTSARRISPLSRHRSARQKPSF